LFVSGCESEHTVLEALARDSIGTDGLFIQPRSRFVAESYQAARDAVDAGYVIAVVAIGLSIYLTWSLRDQFVRLERRRNQWQYCIRWDFLCQASRAHSSLSSWR